jgi:hypothetical protein
MRLANDRMRLANDPHASLETTKDPHASLETCVLLGYKNALEICVLE